MRLILILFVFVGLISGCAKETGDYADPAGGFLPTNYVVYKDSAFTPQHLSLVAGNNITFLNQSAAAIKLMSADSITIPLTIIEPNKFYFFNKDTVGTFYYFNPDRPASNGLIELKP